MQDVDGPEQDFDRLADRQVQVVYRDLLLVHADADRHIPSPLRRTVRRWALANARQGRGRGTRKISGLAGKAANIRADFGAVENGSTSAGHTAAVTQPVGSCGGGARRGVVHVARWFGGWFCVVSGGVGGRPGRRACLAKHGGGGRLTAWHQKRNRLRKSLLCSRILWST
jgi:hypothetical protein